MRPIFLLTSLLVATAATAQTHNPSLTVEGDELVIDAAVAMTPAGVSVELVSGSTLSANEIFQSSDGTSPIRLRMPAGEYEITLWGFADSRESTARNKVAVPVNVGEPDRVQLLVRWYRQYFYSASRWREAVNAIGEIKPTRAEFTQALDALSGN